MKFEINKEYLLSNKEKIIKAAAVIILIAVAFFVFILGGGSGNGSEDVTEPVNITEESAVTPTEPVAMIIVDVAGAVNNPQVVQVKEGSRVGDAIAAAGGLTDKADTTNVNQAAFLTDGEKIFIPVKGETTGNENTNSASGISDGLVNINSATSEELQTLNGIGPVTAEKIIDYRTNTGRFATVDDLKNVDGIGDKTFESIKNDIKV